MTRDERILNDLTMNLINKMLQNIADYVSLCCSAELRQQAVMGELMLALIKLTASFAANQFKVSPAEFANVMGQQFYAAQKAEEEDDDDEATSLR